MAVNIDRETIYTTQNYDYGTHSARKGEDGMTSRQRRRVSKKLNQAEARVKRALESGTLSAVDLREVLADVTGTTDVPSYACRVCFATDDEPCLTKTGNVAKAPHKGRGEN